MTTTPKVDLDRLCLICGTPRARLITVRCRGEDRPYRACDRCLRLDVYGLFAGARQREPLRGEGGGAATPPHDEGGPQQLSLTYR